MTLYFLSVWHEFSRDMVYIRGRPLGGDHHTKTVTSWSNDSAEHRELAYIGMGSNLGDRRANLQAALRLLKEYPTIEIACVSSLYETAPVGMIDQPDFFNLAAALRTSLPPRELLSVLLHIENQMGRVRTLRWGPRVIDIDLLLYEERQITIPGLTLPHPRLRERAFVLVPLVEIAPDLALPRDGARVEDLVRNLPESVNIRRLNGV